MMNQCVRLGLLSLMLMTGPAVAMQADPADPRTTDSTTTEGTAVKLSEAEKIQALIRLVGASDFQFIRNGKRHDADKAAEHLRKKYEYARKREKLAPHVATARAFIKNIASESSFSGKPYQIEFRDGTKVAAGKWLVEQLEKLEAKAENQE